MLNISLYLLLSLWALAIGSLLNVIIHRLPIMMKTEWNSQCSTLLNIPKKKEAKLNLFLPRSFCPRCRVQIPMWHNIPLLSFYLLKGQCKYCQQSISLRYPLVEFITLVAFLLVLSHFGPTVECIFALLFTAGLIGVAFIDWENQLIPDSLSLGLLWLGLLVNTQAYWTTLPDAVFSAAAGYLCLWFFVKLYYFVTKKIGMGNGDFKLFAAFGAWFGWVQLPFILLVGSSLGAIIGFVYLKKTGNHKQTPIPFGPFLCFAGFISLLYGSSIMQWYVRFYL